MIDRNPYLEACRERIEEQLLANLPQADRLPVELHQAMHYSALSPGKRIRPLLVYAAGHALGAAMEALDHQACAVEFIHVYSLIHDDLPAMDDDELRRGQPTCHVKFGEAMAILAGDALQALAFETLSRIPGSDTRKVRMLGILANASGSHGMAGGQAIDLVSTGTRLTIAELENLHIHKTGALIRASVLLGALSADADDEQLRQFDHFAKCIGLAFQIIDDILDVTSDTETLGKTQGKDAEQEKTTYPSLLGVSEARDRAEALYRDAIATLQNFGERADPLRAITETIISRKS
ncbi:MAG: (2E,6E)-farnesyl diphosphate synthase [Gammaproteobacteria bacterium]